VPAAVSPCLEPIARDEMETIAEAIVRPERVGRPRIPLPA
jgi:hypothetical protein